ncbi:MAG: hypothetical protein AMXMBFR25_22950 [Lysobacterales bacterium]
MIAALSLLPVRGPDLHLPNADKLHHALAYAVLMLYFGQLTRRRALIAAALIGYGIAIELLQSQMPSRSAELVDLLANLVGMGFGALLLRSPAGRWLNAVDARLVGRRKL